MQFSEEKIHAKDAMVFLSTHQRSKDVFTPNKYAFLYENIVT